MKQLFFSFTLLLLVSTILPAQSSAFTYQGRLTDNAGPAQGWHDLQFTIHDALNNGSVVGGPIMRVTNVVNGLFTVTLDFGPDVFTGVDRWLEIGVRVDGSTDPYQLLSPRQPLSATPYATRAANVSGNISDAQLSTNIARLDSAPTFAGNVTALGALGITGDRPTIRLNGGASTGNYSWLVHVGNVGIGTLTPGNKLHVAGGVTCTTLNPDQRPQDEGKLRTRHTARHSGQSGVAADLHLELQGTARWPAYRTDGAGFLCRLRLGQQRDNNYERGNRWCGACRDSGIEPEAGTQENGDDG